MSDLPDGWVETQLDRIAQWGSGGTPTRSHPEYYGGAVPWVKTGELGVRVLSRTEETITELGLNNSSAKVFPAGSVVVAMYGATIGKASVLGIDAATNQACAVGVANVEVCSSDYLYFYLVSQKDAFVEAGKGGAQPNISQGVIKSWPIPLAPLAEQRRIADKLDAVLARIDACRERLDRVPSILKRFRQSVLASACSGRLTEEWREANGVNAGWPVVTLAEVASSRLGKMLDAAKNQGTETPYLRNINVRWFGFDVSDIQLMRATDKEVQELAVRNGDILVCEGGEPGRCAVWRGESGAYVFQKALHRVRVGETLLPEWVCYSLKAAAGTGRLADLMTGTTIKHLTGVSLAKFELGLPGLDEQTEIVRRVQVLFALADRIESRLTAARDAVNRATPALLAKAFRGELVPQDPDDEPAHALLERIRQRPAEVRSVRRRSVAARLTAADLLRRIGPESDGIVEFRISSKVIGGARPKPTDVGEHRISWKPSFLTSRTEDDMLTRKNIPSTYLTDILKTRGRLAPKELWLASRLEIDDFYDQLKDEEARGLLRASREGGTVNDVPSIEAMP